MSTELKNRLMSLHWMLAQRKVIYFQPEELLFLGGLHANGRAHNELPPIDQLEHLADVAVLADMLRAKSGVPLKVISAHRSIAYNKAVGGAPRSMHLLSRALDLAPVASQRIDRVRRAAVELHSQKSLPGGLGLYRSFVHVDTGRWRVWSSL